MPERFTFAGAVLAALGVAAGAFGAHALRGKLSPRDLEIFETAVRYQLIHAVALVALGALHRGTPPIAAGGAGWCLGIGTCIFSGSLYLLVATGVRKWGAVTPIGGVLLIVGWALLARAALRG